MIGTDQRRMVYATTAKKEIIPMRPVTKILGALLGAALPISAGAATLGGFYYAPQYDYREFFSIADGKPFQVILDGNPFPAMNYESVAAGLLPQMQSGKPPPALTFTYAQPAELPRPYYRLYLIADTANDLNAYSVCATGNVRHKPAQPGIVHLFAIYCRNEIALSQTTAWTAASSPSDPAINQLFRQLFAVIFTKAPVYDSHPGVNNNIR
jgi:hypothetical protein